MTITDQRAIAGPPDDDDGNSKGKAVELGHSRLRTWADTHSGASGLVLDRRKAAAVANYWARTLPRIAPRLVYRTVRGMVLEVVPITRGVARITEAVLLWTACADLATAKGHAESANKKADIGVKHHAQKSRRTLIVLIGLLSLIGCGVWAYFTHRLWLIAIGIIVLGIVDAAGRRGNAPAEFTPVERPPLAAGMPLRQISEHILAVFGEEGLVVSVVGVIIWDPYKLEWRQKISTYAKIVPEHLRTLERGLGAPKDGCIRMVPGATSNEKTLIIQYGDPLATVEALPYRETGSLSIAAPIPLGEGTADQPFAIQMAGTHIGIVSRTGGAKTSVHLWNMIDGVSACHNARAWGIDLQNGPALPLWGDVLEKTAYTPEDAEKLLDELIAEIYRRMETLNSNIADIAAQLGDGLDATTHSHFNKKISEWSEELAEDYPAIVCFIDEFPILREYDGTPKGSINLLDKVHTVFRLGRKVWISVVFASQKTGNTDTGSTIVKTQTGVWIVGPCFETDTVYVFGTEGRDAGFAPHMLNPSTPGNPTIVADAGKCYIKAPGFEADIYRGARPLTEFEIMKRSARRVSDGLPGTNLGRPGKSGPEVLDAQMVPGSLAAVSAALKACGPKAPRVSTAFVISHAGALGEHWTAEELASALRNELGALGIAAPKARTGRFRDGTPNCYHRADVEAAEAALEAQE